MAIWRFAVVASLGARLLVGQRAGVSDVKFVDHVPTGLWWRDATTDVKLDFLRAFQAGLSVSGLARFDIPIADLASRLDKFYLVEANTCYAYRAGLGRPGSSSKELPRSDSAAIRAKVASTNRRGGVTSPIDEGEGCEAGTNGRAARGSLGCLCPRWL